MLPRLAGGRSPQLSPPTLRVPGQHCTLPPSLYGAILSTSLPPSLYGVLYPLHHCPRHCTVYCGSHGLVHPRADVTSIHLINNTISKVKETYLLTPRMSQRSASNIFVYGPSTQTTLESTEPVFTISGSTVGVLLIVQ